MSPSATRPDVELAAMSTAVRSRLRQRFPSIPADAIDTCLYGAVIELAHARVRNFLPILIERRAAEALRAGPITGSAPPAEGPGDLIGDVGGRQLTASMA